MPRPRGPLLRVVPTEEGLRLIGEVDASTLTLLTEALSTALESTGDVEIDLSDLSFIDVAGVAALVQTAARLRDGRCLVLHNPPRVMRRILTLGWHDDPGANLKVVEG